MKKLVRPLSIVLVLVLALGLLSGCGSKTPSDENTPEFVYSPSYTDIDLDGCYISNSCYYNGRLYFAAMPSNRDVYAADLSEGESPAVDNAMRFYSSADDGSDVQLLSGYVSPAIPEGLEGNVNINRMIAGGDGIWILETLYTYWYDLPAGMTREDESAWDYYHSSENYTLRKLSDTGAELAAVSLDSLKPAAVDGEESYFYINSFTADKDGNLYLTTGDSVVYVLSSAGERLFDLTVDGWINGIITLADGTVAGYVYDKDGASAIKPIDVASKSFGPAAPSAPANAWNFYPGSGDYDFYYGNDSTLFGFDIETGTQTSIVTWINCDVDSNTLVNIMPLADGRIIGLSSNWNDTDVDTELVTMTKVPYTASEKTVLTYACMYLDYNIRAQIIEFNKKSDKYRIELRDYSEYNTDNDYNAGITKLNTEIIAGNVPDIIAVSNLPIRQYAAKGLLEDLWPFIDADTALGGRDALVAPFFAAMEQDGKLYQIDSSFNVMTTMALSAVVGDTPGWTLDEMNAALAKLNPGADIMSHGVTKSEFLSSACSMYMGDLVDWSSGECNFDSQLFIDLLKITEKLPATFDWNNYDFQNDYVEPSVRMNNGDQLMNSYYFYGYSDALYSFNGDPNAYTLIGYPTADGTPGSSFTTSSPLAMSSKCKDKEGAWQFMRTLLTEEYQSEYIWGLPTNQKVLDKQLKDAMTPDTYTDENGNEVQSPKYTYINQAGKEIEIYALDQATADKLTALITDTTRMSSYDQSVSTIITDECAAFFAGDKTAEDTAAAIQSKVKLYINEQK